MISSSYVIIRHHMSGLVVPSRTAWSLTLAYLPVLISSFITSSSSFCEPVYSPACITCSVIPANTDLLIHDLCVIFCYCDTCMFCVNCGHLLYLFTVYSEFKTATRTQQMYYWTLSVIYSFLNLGFLRFF